MAFSKASYHAIVSKIENDILELPARLNHLIDEIKLYNFGIGIFGGVAGIVASQQGAANEIVRLGTEFCQRVNAFLDDLLTVPYAMWDAGNAWVGIASTAGDVGSDLAQQLMSFAPEWTGLAGGAYNEAVQFQPEAAGQICSLAQTASATCLQVAETGETFGAAILLAILNVDAAIPSLDPGTVAGALANSIGQVAQAYTAFELSVRSEGKALKALLDQYYEFPGGNWPRAVTSS